MHGTNLFVINIPCPFSVPKLRFWIFIIGSSFSLALNLLLRVLNPWSDWTMYWHQKPFYHILHSQMRGDGVSASLAGDQWTKRRRGDSGCLESPRWARTGTMFSLHLKAQQESLWPSEVREACQCGVSRSECGLKLLEQKSLTWLLCETG